MWMCWLLPVLLNKLCFIPRRWQCGLKVSLVFYEIKKREGWAGSCLLEAAIRGRMHVDADPMEDLFFIFILFIILFFSLILSFDGLNGCHTSVLKDFCTCWVVTWLLTPQMSSGKVYDSKVWIVDSEYTISRNIRVWKLMPTARLRSVLRSSESHHMPNCSWQSSKSRKRPFRMVFNSHHRLNSRNLLRSHLL